MDSKLRSFNTTLTIRNLYNGNWEQTLFGVSKVSILCRTLPHKNTFPLELSFLITGETLSPVLAYKLELTRVDYISVYALAADRSVNSGIRLPGEPASSNEPANARANHPTWRQASAQPAMPAKAKAEAKAETEW
jgi:hypothetical protein